MLTTGLAVFFLLGGIIAGIVMKQTSAGKKAHLPIIIGVIAALVTVAGSCFTSVPTGHTGVVTTFGRVENFTLDAGIHGKFPWQEVVLLDNRVQKARVELSCFSSDIQEVKVIYTVNYQISKENAMTIYSNIGVNYYDTVITPNVSEAVKVMTARYTAENLVASRDDLSEKTETLLSEQLSRYNILVVGTSIEDMDFTDAFTNAVEAKQVAAQNKLQAEIEQQQKIMEQKSSAERAVIDANAAAEVLRKADGRIAAAVSAAGEA